MEQQSTQSLEKCKILTVGDGDLSLSLALARAYGSDHISLTASVLDSNEDLLESFPDAPLAELKKLQVPILFGVDATQLHHKYPSNHWDIVLFHHPHLGLASLSQDEAIHATRHYQLLCHYFYSAGQVAKRVHVCLCGTQRETWKLDHAAERQQLQLLREIPTAIPFSKVWTNIDLTPAEVQLGHAAPRRYRNGKLGSRHFLGKYGYRHRRTAGERYHGGSLDMNVTGSMHYVFETIPSSEHCEGSTKAKPDATGTLTCLICGALFASLEELEDHLKSPVVPQSAEMTNVKASMIDSEEKQSSSQIDHKDSDFQNNHSQQEAIHQPLPTSQFVVGMEKSTIIVSPDDDGKRLRWFLQHNTSVSKRQAELAVQKGTVWIDDVMSPDSSRILKAGMVVTIFSQEGHPETHAGDMRNTVDLLYHSDPFLVVNKASGIRTKGAMPGTLEFVVSQQRGANYESLSKLDNSCSGLCVLMSQAALRLQSQPPKIIHSLVALVHGCVPDKWFPKFSHSVSIERKWKKQKKRKHIDDVEVKDDDVSLLDASTITIIPLERMANDASVTTTASASCLTTIRIQTEHPSAGSICQWMRHLGYPVVGDMNCRKEYLQLKRAIRNRIKNKLCIVCCQVQWQDEHKNGLVQVPLTNPPIPQKLSAVYWESNFCSSDTSDKTDS